MKNLSAPIILYKTFFFLISYFMLFIPFWHSLFAIKINSLWFNRRFHFDILHDIHNMLLSYLIIYFFIFHHSRLPGWIRSMIPNIFYITEKAWNYYPYTETGKFFFVFFIIWMSVIHFLFLFMLTFSHFNLLLQNSWIK